MSTPAGLDATRPAATTQDEVRRHNLGSLLRLLHLQGATSRADLTALTGLNRSTVRALTTDLVTAGLARESEPVGRGGAGRPSIMVEPESERVFVLALDIGVEHLIATRIGLGGVVLDRREVRQGLADYDVARTLRRLHSLSRTLLSGAPAGSVCGGVGVAVCGIVGMADGLVRFAPNLGWVDVPLRDLLAARLGGALTVTLGNDGDLGAMAEHVRGVAAGASDVIYISGEVGIGGGVILGGRAMSGVGGYGGEIGHMSVNPRGRLCKCGRRGCWETEVGEEAVLLTTGAPAGASLADVLAAHRSGARWTRAGMRRVGRWLGLGVVDLVNLFNPQVIVFGGVTNELFTATEDVVREALGAALAAPREQVRLELPGLGRDSSVLGAAELAFAPLLRDPLGALLVAAPEPGLTRPPRPAVRRSRNGGSAPAARTSVG